MLKRSVLVCLLLALAAPAPGCAVRITGGGVDAVAGSAITGDDCKTTDDGTVQCESMVWSEGFSEGFLGVVGNAIRGILSFFLPGGSPDPPTVVVQLDGESEATE